MPLNRNLLIRLTTIDRCLRNHFKKWTLDDLIEACSDALYEYEGRDENISRRTIQRDIQLMRSEKLGYNAPIVVIDKKYYTYEDQTYSITDIPLSESDIQTLSQAMDILSHFRVFSQFAPVSDIINRLEDHISVEASHRVPAIYLEKNDELKGLNYVSEIYRNIIDKQAMTIDYKSFKANKSHGLVISPYLLKEYRNRWFLLCLNNLTNNILTLALDRILNLSVDKSTIFIDNTFFDPEHYFDDIVGVTKSLQNKAETIKLMVDSDQAPYVFTKPIHPSQRLIKMNSDGSIVISLKVIPNLELEREILGYGEHIEVLQPRLLRGRISRKLLVASQQYQSPIL